MRQGTDEQVLRRIVASELGLGGEEVVYRLRMGHSGGRLGGENLDTFFFSMIRGDYSRHIEAGTGK